MNLRQKQSNDRRQRILDTAECLIRKNGDTSFPIRILAEKSEVSFATPFNLFGSKEGLLYALLSRSLDNIVDEGLRFRSDDPCYHVIEAAENAVKIFSNDPVFLRPLYQILLSVSHPVHRPIFMERTFSYWKIAAETIPDCEALTDPAKLNMLTQALMAHFIGLLELWVHEDMDDEQFRAHTINGVILNTYAFIADKNKSKMMGYLDLKP